MKDLLFFSSPIGLGHATRDAAIASELGCCTRFVTGDAAARFLKGSGFKVTDVYRPPRFVVEEGTLKKPQRWLWQYYMYYRDCKKISSKIIGEQCILVSDEDFASLAVAQRRKIPSVLITDIMKTRFTSGPGSLIEKGMNRSMKRIVSGCDAVIIPEEGTDESNIKRVGPIVRRTEFSRKELRNRFGFDGKTIVVSTGGTSAGSFLISRSLEALCKTRCKCDVVVVTGPSLKREFDGARNLGFVYNLHEIIYAADLVISLAGRSTIDEANAYGTPGIFIPIRNHFEQEDNAKRQGFEYNDIFRLESIIEEKIKSPRTGKRYDGAQKASKIIKDIAQDVQK